MALKHNPEHQETGHVLLVSMILSIGLSLLGAVAMQSGMLEARMAGTWQDRDREFQNLELVLRYVEHELLPSIDIAASGPWRHTLLPSEIAMDLDVEGGAYPVAVVVVREPVPPVLLRGLGGVMTSNPPVGQRFRITVSTQRVDGGEPMSLQAVSGYQAGVRL